MNGDKIKEILQRNSIQLVKVAEKMQITPQDLQSKLKSKDVKTSFLIELCNAINRSVYFFLDEAEVQPKIKQKYPNELGTNLGTEKDENEKYEKSTQKTNISNVANENKEEYNGIVRKLKYADSIVLSNTGAPYYEEPISAGLLDYAEQPTKPIGYIDLPGIKCVAYFPVTGVSFKPIINPGDVIGVDYIGSGEILDPDSIYYIITTHSRMIKHLMDDPEDESQLICLSTNYKEFRIYKEDVKKIYKVVFFGRLL